MTIGKFLHAADLYLGAPREILGELIDFASFDRGRPTTISTNKSGCINRKALDRANAMKTLNSSTIHKLDRILIPAFE